MNSTPRAPTTNSNTLHNKPHSDTIQPGRRSRHRSDSRNHRPNQGERAPHSIQHAPSLHKRLDLRPRRLTVILRPDLRLQRPIRPHHKRKRIRNNPHGQQPRHSIQETTVRRCNQRQRRSITDRPGQVEEDCGGGGRNGRVLRLAGAVDAGPESGGGGGGDLFFVEGLNESRVGYEA